MNFCATPCMIWVKALPAIKAKGNGSQNIMSLTITNKQLLVDYFAKGCKPPDDWRMGTEFESFLLHGDTLQRFPYDGKRSIRTILALMESEGGHPILENNLPIAIHFAHQNNLVTLEPGGQIELSGAPLNNLHQTHAELSKYLIRTKAIAKSVNGIVISMGVDGLCQRESIPWMPKNRYALMKSYMPTRGNLGLDMMTRTCTVQVNVDYESEADMVAKMRVGMALQPLATALFACSPFLEGKLTGYQSYRAHIWQDTDPDRCGILPFVFDDSMGFERYTDYLLGVPLYFVHRQNQYINALGQSFRDFMTGQLPALPGQLPNLDDWTNQTGIAFPEVRLKQYIEMRGADSGPFDMLMALPAFWVGLLYDSLALDEASQLIKSWSICEILALHRQVPRQGLAASFRKSSLQEVAKDVVDISYRGLQRRACMHNDHDESVYLKPLQEIALTGRTIATKMIEMYKKFGAVEAVIRHYKH
jgi:glutamate--cysteine ligase